MIESYRMLLNYFAAENNQSKNGEVQINCNNFDSGLIIKNIDDRSVLIKVKDRTEPQNMRVLFYPIKYNVLEKALSSLEKEIKNDMVGNQI